MNKNADAPSIIPLLLMYLFSFRLARTFDKDARRIVERKTHLTVDNVIDTRSEHSLAQVPFELYSRTCADFLVRKGKRLSAYVSLAVFGFLPPIEPSLRTRVSNEAR